MKKTTKRSAAALRAHAGGAGEVDAPRALRTAEGARAEVSGEPGAESLRVLDACGRLLFEYRPGENKTVLAIPVGDLELSVPEGSVRIAAGRSVQVAAAEKLELTGEQSARLGTIARDGAPAAAVEMDARGLRLGAALLEAVAERAELAAGEARVLARTVATTAQTIEQVAGVIETQAGRIVERAKDLYTEVENVAQTRAGRVRTVVRETFQLFGKRALFRAEQDMKIKGEKIYLA